MRIDDLRLCRVEGPRYHFSSKNWYLDCLKPPVITMQYLCSILA